MEHAFNTNIAMNYDVDTALFIQHLKHWTLKNLANKENIHDGFCWSYDTLEALCIQFPYWSKRQIERIINNAVKSGLVIKGNYNKTAYDRTVWYAITPYVYGYFPELLTEKNIKSLYLSISPNGEMDLTEWGNRFPKTVTPIPDTKPDTKPNKNNKGISNEMLNNVDNLDTPSNFRNNQTLENPLSPKGQNAPDDDALGDYSNNQTLKLVDTQKSKSFSIKNILKTNPFQIPEQTIHDWIENRKKKRIATTKTAWDKINKELAKCDDPISAFEDMVAAGWQSLKADWVNKSTLPAKKSFFDHESTKWADGIEQDMF